jgi:hypothetical protein
MPKYAVILNTTKNATEFRFSVGFYNKQINELEQAGYEIIKIDLIDAMSLKQQLQKLTESSVGFLWLRMHGSPQSMTAAENFEINLENMNQIFNDLPFILHDHSTVFLDSCSTGSLINGCNNMQFAFAKLTLEKQNILIVAPSDDLHVRYFSISVDGSFTFEMIASPRSTKNISVILGQQTKAILNNRLLIDSIEKEKQLKNSLQTNESCPFLRNFIDKFGSNFNLTDQLIGVIKDFKEYDIVLNEVKKLIEVYHANPNDPEGDIIALFGWETATPLASAIYHKHTEMVLYLLAHGADPYFMIKGKTLIDYAKQYDKNNDGYDDAFKLMFINKQRRERHDNSKMYDTIIKGLLDLKNDTTNANNRIKLLGLKENYQPTFFTPTYEVAIPRCGGWGSKLQISQVLL